MRRLQITLSILALIPLATGLIDLLLGLDATKPLGAAVSPGTYDDALMNSQFRFLSAVWIGFGVLLYIAARDIKKYSLLLRVLLSSVFLGGVGRIATILQFGLPASSVGSIFIVATLAIETVGMLLLLWWHARLLRR